MDPRPWTLNELYWMHRGMDMAKWTHTAQAMSVHTKQKMLDLHPYGADMRAEARKMRELTDTRSPEEINEEMRDFLGGLK